MEGTGPSVQRALTNEAEGMDGRGGDGAEMEGLDWKMRKGDVGGTYVFDPVRGDPVEALEEEERGEQRDEVRIEVVPIQSSAEKKEGTRKEGETVPEHGERQHCFGEEVP